MREYTFSLPPRLNEMYNPHPSGRGILLSAEAREWKAEAGWLALQQGAELLTGKLHVWIDWYLKRDADIDARIKPTLDALEGIVWSNDGIIWKLDIEKHIDKQAPRMVLRVAVIDDPA
mgnify:CR=1 FL=1